MINIGFAAFGLFRPITKGALGSELLPISWVLSSDFPRDCGDCEISQRCTFPHVKEFVVMRVKNCVKNLERKFCLGAMVIEGEAKNARLLVAQFLRRTIMGSGDAVGARDNSMLHSFIVEKLKMAAFPDGHRHYKYDDPYDGYSSESAHTALMKIMDEQHAYTSGQKHPPLVKFEKNLLAYIRTQYELLGVDIPDNIFRNSYDTSKRSPFASSHYLLNDSDHAEYLCRRFLDKAANTPRQQMGLRDDGSSGLVALIVLEDFHSSGKVHGAVTYTDLFDIEVEPIERIDVDGQSYQVRRICPPAKPTLSHSSVGHDVRERYTGPARKDRKYEQSIFALQHRVMGDLLDIAVGHIYCKIKSISDLLEGRFNSGSLFRTVLDVEKGAVFAYQVDHGRFWVFGFCPVQGKVPEAERVLRDLIVEHYQDAISR